MLMDSLSPLESFSLRERGRQRVLQARQRDEQCLSQHLQKNLLGRSALPHNVAIVICEFLVIF